jgi:hypothetical protein
MNVKVLGDEEGIGHLAHGSDLVADMLKVRPGGRLDLAGRPGKADLSRRYPTAKQGDVGRGGSAEFLAR